MRELSVNVDHVATLRQARRERFPDPVHFALLAETGGASGITCHLRSDRRHIQDDDVHRLKSAIKGELNLEMAATEEMVSIALSVKPHQVSLVPERPEEVTTEGGLDLKSRFDAVKPYAERIVAAGIRLSCFIEAEEEMVANAKKLGAKRVEFNTDAYARQLERRDVLTALLRERAQHAASLGLEVHVGHALDYENVPPLMGIKEIRGASIGFSIIARSLEVGMEEAVEEMVKLIGKET